MDKCPDSTDSRFLIDMLRRAYPEEMVYENERQEAEPCSGQGAKILSMMPPEQLMRRILLMQRGEGYRIYSQFLTT